MKRALIAAVSVAAVAAGVAGIAIADSAGSDPSATCDPPSYDGTSLSLHCTVPQVTNTVTQTDTATVTETATATETVPGPTSTVTETQTVTVTPTPTQPPPPVFFAPGQAMNATNTGYAGDGLTAADLTPVTGPVTYGTAFNGQTITGKAYSNTVTVTGSNITIRDCSLTYGGLDTFGFRLAGSNNRVDHCTITSPAGQSMYEPVFFNPGSNGNSATYNNISRGAQAITTYGVNVTIANNYTHDTSTASDSTQHPDGIEVYGGGPVLIRDNRIEEDNPYDAPINVAPWGSYKVQGLTVQGNFLDNGQSIILLDNQNSSCAGATGDCLINTRVLRNAFGGHQCPASNVYCFHVFHPTLLYEARSFVQTDAALTSNPNNVLFPTTGPDVNRWEESNDIATPSTPHDGDIVTPGT